MYIFLSVVIITLLSLPTVAVAQEKQEQEKQEIEKYKEVKKAAKEAKTEEAVKEDATGNDPRAFSNKWMPLYRYTELENGLIQQDVNAFGTVAFSNVVGMFYELPLTQYRDLSDVSGLPADVPTDAIGVGDISLKFLIRPKSLDFSYGEPGEMNKKSGSVMLGMDFVLPTATNPALAGNAFVFAPILALVIDTPFYGFFAMLNLYYFDVYKMDSAPETSRYVGRWFYMQPLTKPGPWWGGFFLMPEFQPIYDFKAKDFSLWIGVELGKVLAPGRVVYIKTGWGIKNSEQMDRKFSFEAGFRWFF
jgi:hypothetical protein